MSKLAGRPPHSLWLLLVLLALAVGGCSDDETVTDPVEDPDPQSYLWQINALPDGTAFAAGLEGFTGRLYTNLSGVWAAHENQPAESSPLFANAPIGVLPLSLTDLYVFSRIPGGIFHLEGDEWIAQSMEVAPSFGTLEQTTSGLWFLGSEGVLLQEGDGSWDIVLDSGDADSFLADVTESPDGTVFVSQVFIDQDIGRVHRISPGGAIVADDLDTPVFALAATATDTVWGGGTRLSCFAESSWDTVVSIPDSNLVVAIGRPADNSLTLVCEMGAIYRWQNGVLTTVQGDNLVGPLVSVSYIDETNILGSLNYTDENTGHDTGLIVRFDGSSWVTLFLAPPS